MARVRLENIHVRYGRTVALDGVDLEIPDGTFCVVFGPAGAGKTTLLNVIGGLRRPDAGRVYFDNGDVENIPAWQRDAAMVFESYALYPHMTIRDNLRMPLARRGYGQQQMQDEITAIARTLGIETLLDRKPATLSNGQRQRVGLGRALVRPSRVLLMDEPLSHLDAQLASMMRPEFKSLQRRFSRTVVYVTHDFREALGLADMLVILDHGTVVQVGTPREIFEQPASDLACRLLGDPPRSMVPIELRQDGSRTAVLDGSATITVPGWARDGASGRLLAAVLPGRMWLGDDTGNDPAAGRQDQQVTRAVLEATVRTVERRGFKNVVYAATAAGTDLTFYASPDSGLDVRDRVRVVVDLDGVVYLDADTGLRISPDVPMPTTVGG